MASKEKSSLIFFLVTVFSILTVLVAKQVTRPLDLATMYFLQRFANLWLDRGLFLLTWFGSVEFSCFVLLMLSWHLYQKYQWPGVFLYLFFFVALSGFEFLWKYVVAYTGPGPEFDRHPFLVGLIKIAIPYSFPSGHTFRSVFLLGMWFERLDHPQLPQKGNKGLQKAFIAVLIFLVGLSRVYLGDHWLSDVIGGMLLAWIGLLLVSQSRHYELNLV